MDKEIEKALPAKEVNGSPGGDKQPEWKRRVNDGRIGGGRSGAAQRGHELPPDAGSPSSPEGPQPGYRRPNWESRVYDGWISGGRSLVRHSDTDTLPAGLERRAVAVEAPPYAELHSHTNYSFKEGASEAWDLLVTAKELGLQALAITDHDNVCGAMEFAQSAESIGIKPIIGIEATLAGGSHLTLIAETAAGYRNISLLTTRAHIDAEERNEPALDPALLAGHSEGIICLSGCRHGEISSLLLADDYEGAKAVARQYLEWFGAGSFFLELQQNLVKGDTLRNRLMARLGRELGIGLVATNNVHYHVQERSRLNDALVAIQHNRSLEETHRERRPNDQFYLKSPQEMAMLFGEYPEAIANTVAIADRCEFSITSDPIYKFPDYAAPEGHTAASWLRKICDEAAVHKYGEITPLVKERLDREFRLLEMHDLAGFLLQYSDIIQIAHDVQIDLGIVDPGTSIDDHPPGRGRGSSVAMVVGYLIGLSHIDPLKFDLKLERFLSEDMGGPPDIDLDFPRAIREELILRVHKLWGYERAVLTGMISTYKVRGAIRDLGKALGLPEEDLDKLIKQMDGHAGIRGLANEIASLPEYRDRLDAPLWKELIELALQLNHFPKYLAQHPGGMILSARPLSETVPLQRSAIEGRYICQWDKNSAEDAGFVKIDFLALGALSQMTEALELIRRQREERIDLSRIDFDDAAVYRDIHEADTIGVFQIESAAQMQTVVRLKPKNLTEMAWEVGAVRPGVGVNDGVSMLIRRHLGQEPVTYDHPLEKPALERTYGVPLYQDQLGELAVSVAGMSVAEGDQMRRAFSRRDSDLKVPMWHERFIRGAVGKGVPLEAAEKVFQKFHGLYQFPEAHAFAFGITAYQMSWLKHYYPLEFFVGLFNNQPMGFYNLETLKQDAVRHGVTVLKPDANLSGELAVTEDGKLRMGIKHVAKVQSATSARVLAAREAGGPFRSLADFMARTGVQHEVVDNLAAAGTLDCFDRQPAGVADRRTLRWEVGLRYRPVGQQLTFEMPVEQDMVALSDESEWDRMMGEYRTLGVHPDGHLMSSIRPMLPADVLRSDRLHEYPEGARVCVAGLVIRRQRPSGKATFITLEDEFGHSPLVIWPAIYKRIRLEAQKPLLLAHGTVSRRDGTLNIVVDTIRAISAEAPALRTKDWG